MVAHLSRHNVLLGAIVLTASLAACGEDPGATCHGGDCLFKVSKQLTLIETRPAAKTAVAGDPLGIACLAHYDDGTSEAIPNLEATLDITPSDQVTVVDGTMRAALAGTYQVKCKARGLTDPTGVSITVTPGGPARVRAVLDHAMVVAGGSVNVTCILEDARGNPASGPTLHVEAQPADGVSISAMAITTRKAGMYQVGCWPSTGQLEVIPAALTVSPGEPVSIFTQLSADTVEAGTNVGVTCVLADASGNPVDAATQFSTMPAPTRSDPMGLTAEAAGDYSVTCSLPGSHLSGMPAFLHVTAALPTRLTITGVTPQKMYYARADTVEVLAHVVDSFGNECTSAIWAVHGVQTNSTVDLGTHSVLLTGSGMIQLLAAVTSPTPHGVTVSDTVTINVDANPPEVIVDFPARGEMVVGAPNQILVIRGRATDAETRVVSLVVNNAMIAFDTSGHFTTAMQPKWGINLITGQAVDAAGNRRDFAQSFEYGSDYKRANANNIPAGRIANGVIAHLGQDAFNDGDGDPDDLVTLAHLAIDRMDINALIPNPATTYHSDCSIPFVSITGNLQLHVDAVRYGEPALSMTAIDGGLHLRVEVPNLEIDIHTSGDVCDVGVGIGGNATASSIVVEGDLLVSANGGRVSVSMPNPSVNVSGLHIHINLPSVISWAVDGIINLFHGALTSKLESAFRQVISDRIPPLVAGFLQSERLGTGVNLPAPLNLRMNLDTTLGLVAFDTNGGSIGLDATIFTAGRMTPEPRGGLLQETRDLPTFRADRGLGVALSYDLMNQAFYSLWYGGALDLDLAQFLPASVRNGSNMIHITAHARGLVPPVISPTTDPNFPVELQVGDLQLVLGVEGIPNIPRIDITAYATIYIQANASIDANNVVQLALGPNPKIVLDFRTPLDGVVNVADLVNQLTQTLGAFVPQLFAYVIHGIPIPSFDLSNIAGNYLPPGIVLGLGNAQTRFHPNYLILEGDLVQR